MNEIDEGIWTTVKETSEWGLQTYVPGRGTKKITG